MMKPYESYKETDQLWIEKVPIEWDMIKTKYLFDERSEKGYPDEQLLVASQNMGVVPKGVYGNRTVEASKDLHLLKLVKVGDFVISLRSFQGGIEYAYYQGIISPAYTVMKSKDRLTQGYFRHLAKSKTFIELLQMCVTGIREGQNIDYNKLKNFRLPVPPRSEQDQIVHYLDWQLSKINKLIKAKKKQIELLNEQKQAIINKAVTKGLDDTVPMKDSGVYWQSIIPTTWNIVPLKRIMSTPMCDGPHETPIFYDLGVPFVSAEAAHDGRIYLEHCRGYISQEQHEIYCKKVKPQKNDIYIVKSGSTTGKVVLVDIDEEFSIWSPLALVRCKSSTHFKFVYYCISSSYFQQQVRDNWSFGTQPNIGMGVLQNLSIILPNIDEQIRIANEIDDRLKYIDIIITYEQESIEKIYEYKTSLISSVATGKIDVRDIEIPTFEVETDDDQQDIDDTEETEDIEEPEVE